MQLIRSATSVGLYTIGSRIMGFFRDVLMASYIGTGVVMDALVIAIKIPSFLRRIVAEGAFNAAFVPMFTHLLTSRSREEVTLFASQILSLLVTILLGVILITEIFLPSLLPALMPGLKSEVLHLSIHFTRITLPFIIFISVTALCIGILTSLDRFIAAASSPLIGGFFIVIVLLMAGPRYVSEGSLVALAILGSGLLQTLWVLVPCRMAGITLTLKMPKSTEGTRQFFRKMLPGAVGSGITQINLFVDTIIGSFLPTGTISYLYYADRLNQLPISVIGSAISTALLPLMARQWRQNNIESAMHNQNRALEFCMLIALPTMLILTILSYPLIFVLFQRNAFRAEATLETAHTLIAFASGLPAYILIKIFNTSFFSRQDTSTPIRIAMISILLNLAFNIIFIRSFKHVGIAFSTSLSAWISALALGIILWKREFLKIDATLKKFIPRLLLSAAFTYGFLILLQHYLLPSLFSAQIWWHRSGILMMLVGGGIFSFILSAYMMGCLRFTELPIHTKI